MCWTFQNINPGSQIKYGQEQTVCVLPKPMWHWNSVVTRLPTAVWHSDVINSFLWIWWIWWTDPLYRTRYQVPYTGRGVKLFIMDAARSSDQQPGTWYQLRSSNSEKKVSKIVWYNEQQHNVIWFIKFPSLVIVSYLPYYSWKCWMEAANLGPSLTIDWIGWHDSSFGEPHYLNNPPHFDVPSECTVMQWTLSRRMTILCQNRQQGVISTMALQIRWFWNKGNRIFRNLFFVAFCVAFIIMMVVFDGVISDSVAAAATLPPVWLFSINSRSKSVNIYSGIVKYALL